MPRTPTPIRTVRPIRRGVARLLPSIVVATLLPGTAVVAAGTAGPTAPASAWTHAPFETLGDDHRVREGHVGSPDALAADIAAASNGRVVGGTPAHDALLRTRPERPTAASTAPVHPYGRYDRGEATWIADVGVLLRGDADGDRFFGAVELSIDVDTESVEREVYATIELTEFDGTPTLVHTTRSFTVRGNATSDVYRIEIELLDNHRAADRDVRIEVRDGWSDVLLDAVSPYELASLGALPLEAERPLVPIRDDGRHPDEESDYALGVLLTGSTHGDGYHESDAYVAGYAGAAGPAGFLALLGLAFARRHTARQRPGSALVDAAGDVHRRRTARERRNPSL